MQAEKVVKLPAARARKKKLVAVTKAQRRTVGQVIAAGAAAFLPVASYVLAHHEVAAQPMLWVLVVAALAFSAPTLIDWTQKWCRGLYKAWGFTVLLEGVMVFSHTPALALAGLSILVAINCHSAWQLAGKVVSK